MRRGNKTDNTQQKLGLTSIGDVLKKFKKDKDSQSLPSEYSRDKYVSFEFQKYGYDLAQELGESKNVSLYIKLAKETPRAMLENARNYIKDAYQVQSRAKLFMWKLQKIKEEQKSKKEIK